MLVHLVLIIKYFIILDLCCAFLNPLPSTFTFILSIYSIIYVQFLCMVLLWVCCRTACSMKLLEPIWNKQLTTLNKLDGTMSNMFKGCSNKTDKVMI